MRAFDRDLIRGGHYGQRSRVPRKQAEHMAAPTNAARVKILLANSEPSTHGSTLELARGKVGHRDWAEDDNVRFYVLQGDN